MPPTNLLLVFADQMRGQAMGCAGEGQLPTPHLDRLAAQGVRFTRACCNSPVCTPSRGTLLTGLYPHRHGAYVNDIPIRTDLSSLGTIFRDAGYATGYVGKWHLDGVPRDKFTPPGPRRLGFDAFWAVHNCTHAYLSAFHYRDTDQRIPSQGYEPEFQTGLALDFLRRHAREPFCLVLSWGTPHDPYQKMPDVYRRQFDPAAIRLRPNVPAEVAEASRRDIAGYYGHIVALDEYVGRLMATLDELRLAEDTLVVFTSDHGDMLGSQGLVRKQRPWEESIQVPLVVRHPGRIPAGRTSDELVSMVDLLPTLCGLTGIGGTGDMQGTDLSATMTGMAPGRDEVLLLNPCSVDDGRANPGWWGLRTPRHTYARTLNGPWVLHDNQRDPYQMTNLVAQPEAAEWVRRLDARVLRAFEEIGDPVRPWQESLREMGLVEAWNTREEHFHGRSPGVARPIR
jgi:arylsulfatase A-like enzyme